MTKIWDSESYSGGTLLVALALADFASDTGTRVFPHVETLAKKARLSTRATQMALQVLIGDLFLIPVGNAKGGRGKSVEYNISLKRVQELLEGIKGAVFDEKGCNPQHERVQSVPERVQNATSHIEEPPSNHQENHQENRQTSLSLISDQGEANLVDLCVQAFNEGAAQCPKWTRCKTVTPNRRKVILARLKERGLGGWRDAVVMAAKSGFLGGEIPTSGTHLNWRMDIAWFAKAENFAKISEGGYPVGPRGPAPSRTMESASRGIRAGLGRG
jgi:hypothetical protein